MLDLVLRYVRVCTSCLPVVEITFVVTMQYHLQNHHRCQHLPRSVAVQPSWVTDRGSSPHCLGSIHGQGLGTSCTRVRRPHLSLGLHHDHSYTPGLKPACNFIPSFKSNSKCTGTVSVGPNIFAASRLRRPRHLRGYALSFTLRYRFNLPASTHHCCACS